MSEFQPLEKYEVLTIDEIRENLSTEETGNFSYIELVHIRDYVHALASIFIDSLPHGSP